MKIKDRTNPKESIYGGAKYLRKMLDKIPSQINSKDKIWYKNVGLDELEREKEWLTVAIYDSVFKGRVEEINLNDKYKL